MQDNYVTIMQWVKVIGKPCKGKLYARLSLSYSLCKLQKDIVGDTIKKQLKYRGKNGKKISRKRSRYKY